MRIVTARRLLAIVRGIDVDKARRRDVREGMRVRRVEERLYEHLGGCVRDEGGHLNLYRAPPYLSDQALAVALLERALPGWDWSVSRTKPCEPSEGLPFYSDCGTQGGVDGGEPLEFARAGGSSPALAVVTAMLRAWILTAGHEARRQGTVARLPGT